jgi:hypothetical protein
VRLYLNTHVKRVGYHEKNPSLMNKLVYLRKPSCKTNLKPREITKSYDHTVITFPLVRNTEKTQTNFDLDILYRDFMNCELHSVYSYIVEGKLSCKFLNEASFTKNKDLVNFHTMDPLLKFQAIKTLTPTTQNPSKNHSPNLFAINSSHKDLSEAELNSIFERGFMIVDKKMTTPGPVNKKFQYSHTAFPQIILDGKRRSRIFYLNSLEWLESSREMGVISARNIALQIAKKELSGNVAFGDNSRGNFHGSDTDLSANNSRVKKITYFSLLTTLSFYILIKRAKSFSE